MLDEWGKDKTYQEADKNNHPHRISHIHIIARDGDKGPAQPRIKEKWEKMRALRIIVNPEINEFLKHSLVLRNSSRKR